MVVVGPPCWTLDYCFSKEIPLQVQVDSMYLSLVDDASASRNHMEDILQQLIKFENESMQLASMKPDDFHLQHMSVSSKVNGPTSFKFVSSSPASSSSER